MDDLVTYEIAKKLKEKGFDERCEFTFYNNYRVRDEIYEKHPGLSDDGYEDLRKKYGGPYKDEEVYGYYIEPLKLYSHNSTIGVNPITKQKVATNELCSCPNIYQVMKWLKKEYFIHISTKPYPCEDGIMWLYEIRKFSKYISAVVTTKTGFIKEEQATLAGIEYILENLI